MGKRYNDPVHGAVELNDLEHQVASSKSFLRLHNVKQLGLGGLVYPSANYSRLSHSLGVCHIAGEMLNAIDQSLPGTISSRDRQVTRLAALLHDVGHYPFSHATEEATKELASGAILDDETTAVGKSYFKDHEAVGRFIVENDPQIVDILSQGGINPVEIFDRIEGADDLSPKSPPVLRRVLGLMFGPKRPVFPVPDCWQIRWA